MLGDRRDRAGARARGERPTRRGRRPSARGRARRPSRAGERRGRRPRRRPRSIDAYGERIRRYIAFRVRSPEDAEDLTVRRLPARPERPGPDRRRAPGRPGCSGSPTTRSSTTTGGAGSRSRSSASSSGPTTRRACPTGRSGTRSCGRSTRALADARRPPACRDLPALLRGPRVRRHRDGHGHPGGHRPDASSIAASRRSRRSWPSSDRRAEPSDERRRPADRTARPGRSARARRGRRGRPAGLRGGRGRPVGGPTRRPGPGGERGRRAARSGRPRSAASVATPRRSARPTSRCSIRTPRARRSGRPRRRRPRDRAATGPRRRRPTAAGRPPAPALGTGRRAGGGRRSSSWRSRSSDPGLLASVGGGDAARPTSGSVGRRDRPRHPRASPRRPPSDADLRPDVAAPDAAPDRRQGRAGDRVRAARGRARHRLLDAVLGRDPGHDHRVATGRQRAAVPLHGLDAGRPRTSGREGRLDRRHIVVSPDGQRVVFAETADFDPDAGVRDRRDTPLDGPAAHAAPGPRLVGRRLAGSSSARSRRPGRS